jgi:DNA polymerase III epsilon subunit-like protein
MKKESDTPKSVVFIDVETGGLDPSRHALLSIGLVHWNDGIIKEKLEIFILPGEKEISSSALTINGINLQEHSKKALPINQAIEVFRNFISRISIKSIIGGHNTLFDAQFLTYQGINLRDYFLYGYIDTKAIARFLIHAHVIESDSTSLKNLCDLYSIEIDVHNALGDALASALLYNKFIELMRGSNGN